MRIRITRELAIIALTVAILTVAFRRVSAGQWTQLYWIVTIAAPCALIFYACARPVSLAPVLRRIPGEIKYGWLLLNYAILFYVWTLVVSAV